MNHCKTCGREIDNTSIEYCNFCLATKQQDIRTNVKKGSVVMAGLFLIIKVALKIFKKG